MNKVQYIVLLIDEKDLEDKENIDENEIDLKLYVS